MSSRVLADKIAAKFNAAADAAAADLESSIDAVKAAKEDADMRLGTSIVAIEMRCDALNIMANSALCLIGRKDKHFSEELEEEPTVDLETPALSMPPHVPAYSARLLGIVDALRQKIAADADPTRWTRDAIETESRSMIVGMSKRDAGAIATFLLPDSARGK
jgi:hypothetical protein